MCDNYRRQGFKYNYQQRSNNGNFGKISKTLYSFSKERQRVDLPTCLAPESNIAGDIAKATLPYRNLHDKYNYQKVDSIRIELF